MRKNLTVSLTSDDWRKVQALARSLGSTYSQVFHKLIAASASTVSDQKRVEKYRALLAPQADYFAQRAGVFARARKRAKAAA